MPATLASLGIDDWSDEELVAIRDEIDARLSGAAAPHLSAELMADLDRRLADAEANPGVGYSWDEVMAFCFDDKVPS